MKRAQIMTSKRRNTLKRTVLFITLLASLVVLPASLTFAQKVPPTVLIKEKRLQQLLSEQQILQEKIEQAENMLAKAKASDDSSESNDYLSLKSQLELAEQRHKAEPNDENKSTADNLRFKYFLAERRWAKSNAPLIDLDQKTNELRNKLQDITQKIEKAGIEVAQARKAMTKNAQANLAKAQKNSSNQQRQINSLKKQLNTANARSRSLIDELEVLKSVLQMKDQQTDQLNKEINSLKAELEIYQTTRAAPILMNQ